MRDRLKLRAGTGAHKLAAPHTCCGADLLRVGAALEDDGAALADSLSCGCLPTSTYTDRVREKGFGIDRGADRVGHEICGDHAATNFRRDNAFAHR